MNPEPSTSRRDFLAASTTLAASALSAGGVFAASNDTLKIGLVGCGGRGTGAAADALRADPNVKLVAMADVFKDRIEEHLAILKRSKDVSAKIDVTPETCFDGFDGYKKVIDMCDVVLLCTPPHFRPQHLRAAVEAKKHVFCEKPVAVDPAGVRSVIETAKLAKDTGKCLMSGFCYRYDFGKRETIKRIHDGAIGNVVAMHVNYLANELWHRGSNPKWSEMEYQLRNWYYFNWLSGDHIVEQHCHNLDKVSWVMKGEMPVSAVGTGGRQKRTDPKYGNIFDHHSVIFEYANGTKLFSFCRQMNGCVSDVSDHIIGTKGSAHLMRHLIQGEKAWQYEGPEPSMYQIEHNELFAAIRSGKVINDGESAAYSTLMSIMGRTATYTGRRVNWKDLLVSKENLSPPKYEWGPLPVAPVAVPGMRA